MLVIQQSRYQEDSLYTYMFNHPLYKIYKNIPVHVHKNISGQYLFRSRKGNEPQLPILEATFIKKLKRTRNKINYE